MTAQPVLSDAGEWYRKGVACERMGDAAGAIAAYNNALKGKADYKEACAALASMLERTGHREPAIKTYEYLLKLEQTGYTKIPPPSDNATRKILHDLLAKGLTLYKQGNLEGALATQQNAVKLYPDFVEALNEMGILLCHLRRYDEAQKVLLQCLRAKPGHVPALNVLGAACTELGQIAKAIACYRLAVAAEPSGLNALLNIGEMYFQLQEYKQAIEAFERVLRVNPDCLDALVNLIYLNHMFCQWEHVQSTKTRLLKVMQAKDKCAKPFMATLYVSGTLQLANAKRWTLWRYPAAKAYDGNTTLPQAVRKNGKLRIGYLSSDFREHATTRLISELFEHHDRTHFEIYVYSYGSNDMSPARERIRTSVDQFRDVANRGDREIAEQIQQDGIDILVDLKGYTQENRLRIMSYRPAPIQMHYLGFPGTLGADFIDYFIADPITAPAGSDALFSECLIRLPHCYQINDSKRPLPANARTRKEYGLPEHGFVFCDFNAPYKITSEIFAVWMRLLKAVEGSVLWLHEPQGDATDQLHKEAGRHGIDPKRLIMAEKLPQAQHLARYARADLFLDTSPVCGHTTTSDALWCGVPVIALEGDSFISRVSASLLAAVELSELVVPDLKAYEAFALALARDTKRLTTLKRHLQEGRTRFALFDSPATTKAIEAAYLHAAKRHISGRAPAAFALSEDLHVS